MKTTVLILGLFTLLTNAAFAQVIWKGGTPGAETKWDEARNWSTNKVPTDLDDVIIPDLSSKGDFYPVINTKVPPIAHLNIQGGAILDITTKGELIIDGSNTYNNGITLVGHIHNKGEINIIDPAMKAIEILRSNYRSVGTVAIINSQADSLARQ